MVMDSKSATGKTTYESIRNFFKLFNLLLLEFERMRLNI